MCLCVCVCGEGGGAINAGGQQRQRVRVHHGMPAAAGHAQLLLFVKVAGRLRCLWAWPCGFGSAPADHGLCGPPVACTSPAAWRLPPQVGIQEKATFVQAFNKPPSLHASILALPAALVVLLLALALAVLYHHAPAAAAPAPASGEQERLIAGASSGGGGPAAAEGDHAQDYDDLHSA